MTRTTAVVAAVTAAACLMATAASAMSVQEFLSTAAHVPHNPTALLRPDARRLMGEIQGAFATLKTERETAVAAHRQPAYCPPVGQHARISADDILARLNAVPASRRSISVTQAMREWMAERYPCPAA
ncbi:hypothetical protein BH10PSE2_BH10PSE2_08010 [soil metagenome]